jgi:uncharacterized protein (DUF2249 family)
LNKAGSLPQKRLQISIRLTNILISGMLINEHTKIAALLKHNPEALEAIVPLSSDFTKLRNPILRKLMAGRTSIAMACKIGGCTPLDFFTALKPLGFEIDTKQQLIEQVEPTSKSLPSYLQQINADQIISLDVRAMLSQGNDPLQLIQKTVKQLQQGQVLKIINTFEPTPLIKLLGKQGFETYVDVLNKDVIETYFYKQTNEANPQLEAKAIDGDDWDVLMNRFENRVQQVDVRHLEMPQPMTTILEALETLPVDHALYVHHKRVPVFLLTELKDRQFNFRIKEADTGEVYLLIFKN